MRGLFRWGIIVLVLLGFGIGLFVFKGLKEAPVVFPTPTPEVFSTKKIIGKSIEGRSIEAYTFGNGGKHILFVGGIHGGYEWNSVILSYQFIDYIEANPEIFPEDLKVTVIPSLNPDGVFKVVSKEGRFASADVSVDASTKASGRFNANEVDLNRNFDCKWQSESMWQGKKVSAGTRPFSEPEALALRDFVLTNRPEAAVFWHSQANAVYASECEAGILPETLDVMNAYSRAAGYKPVESFDSYVITGDAEGWLSSIGIPAITVELSTHETIEWEKNLAGVKALFDYYEGEF